jgi:hypothetical protein
MADPPLAIPIVVKFPVNANTICDAVKLETLNDVNVGNVDCVIVDVIPAEPVELYGVTLYPYTVLAVNPEASV